MKQEYGIVFFHFFLAVLAICASQEENDCDQTGLVCSDTKLQYCYEVGKEPENIVDCKTTEMKACGRTEDGEFGCVERVEDEEPPPNFEIICRTGYNGTIPDITTCDRYIKCRDKSVVRCPPNKFVVPLKGTPCLQTRGCIFEKVKDCKFIGRQQKIKLESGRNTPFCYICTKDRIWVYPCSEV